MPRYSVDWTTDTIEAATPEEAARAALAILRNPDNEVRFNLYPEGSAISGDPAVSRLAVYSLSEKKS